MTCVPGFGVELPSNSSLETLNVRRCLTVAGVDIAPTPALTPGSIPFAGPTGALTQDNAMLFFNNATGSVGIGTNAPFAGRRLTVKNDNALFSVAVVQNSNPLGFSSIGYLDELGATQLGIGYANATDNAFIDFNGGLANGLVIASGGVGTDKFAFFPTGVMRFYASAAPALSAAGTASLAVIAGVLQMSTNGGAYGPLTSSPAALPVSSVPFADASGLLTSDNNLQFDNVNKRLAVGKAGVAPTYPLSVRADAELYAVEAICAAAAGNCILMQNSDTTGFTTLVGLDNAAALAFSFGHGNPTVATVHLRNLNFIFSAGVDFAVSNATANEHRFGATNGSAFYQINGGAAAPVSAAGTARIIYDQGTNQVKVSKNGGAYAVLI
jgi:hypothetical protein